VEGFNFHSTFNATDGNSLPLFYQKSYIDLNTFEHLYFNYQIIKDSSLHLLVSKKENTLISLQQSPFGSIIQLGNSAAYLSKFLDQIKSYMHENGFSDLILNHPPTIYKNHIGLSLLIQSGFRIILQDDHQFIDLSKPVNLHPMEKRILNNLHEKKVVVRQVQKNEWPVLYQLIANSRIEKGLIINIDLPRLLKLQELFPNKYMGWIVEDNNEWISGLITVKVSHDVVYYYLPATPDRFQNMSPMVKLLHETTNFFKKENFNYYDLGISSVNGARQSGLFQFKSRMGAKSAHRIKLQLKT